MSNYNCLVTNNNTNPPISIITDLHYIFAEDKEY